FATARLAPYPGWEALREIAEVNLTGAKKVIGRRHPSRIGVRYINRIDIPWSQLDGRDLGEFLKLGVALPRDIDRGMSAYSLSVEFREKETDIKVVVRSGTVVPVLIDHFSLMLDLDLILDRDIPGRPEGWWERLDLVRKAKNRVFEASITDKVRELFQ
ncbi:MAG: hypothetical protein K0R61_4126, partial [Microvirga sp.]|nr:hypothetical protein [Microvirga sp.]